MLSKCDLDRAKRDHWRLECIEAAILGLSRPLEVYRCSRKSNLIKPWDKDGKQKNYCPAHWADLAIGSGACGLRCRACFLILTLRSLCDPSRHLLYDNIDDYEEAVINWLLQPKEQYRNLGLGIDSSDSLLYEGVTGHARRLIPLFADEGRNPQGSKLILLTKSVNVRFLKGLPTKNILLTHSLNPEEIADLWEGKFDDGVRVTPPISRRLDDSKWGAEMGFEIRWRIDPILEVDHWEDIYQEFFLTAARSGHKPARITLGTYREMNRSLDTHRKNWGLPPLEWQKPQVTPDGKHYHISDRTSIYRQVYSMIKRAWAPTGYTPVVGLCKEPRSLHADSGTVFGHCNCEGV